MECRHPSVRRFCVVRFTTPDDREVTTQLPAGQLRGTPVGARVTIRYLPERPKIARSSDRRIRYFSSLVTTAIFIALGVSALSAHR